MREVAGLQRVLPWPWLRPSARARRLAVLWLGFLVLALFLGLSAVSLNRPYLGVDISEQNGYFVVSSADVGGLAYNAGIRPGDRVIEADGRPLVPDQAQLRSFKAKPTESITVMGAGSSPIAVQVEGSAASGRAIFEPLGVLIIGLAFWLVGFYGVVKRPDSSPARLLYLASCGIILALITPLGATRNVPSAFTLEVVDWLVLPALLAHLFLEFPGGQERGGLAARLPRVLYLWAVLCVIGYFAFGHREAIFYPYFRSFVFINLTAGLLLGLGALIRNWLRARQARIRQQIKIVVAGSVIGVVPLLALSLLPEVLMGKTLVNPHIAALTAIFIPVSIAYTIVRHRLLDIDLVIGRGIVYALVVTLLVVLLSLCLIALGTYWRSLAIGWQVAMALGLSAVAAVLFGPVKQKADTAVDRTFYRDRYSHRIMANTLSDSIASLKDLAEVSDFIAGALVRVLNLAGACLWVRTATGSLQVVAARGTLDDPVIQGEISSLFPKLDAGSTFPNPAASLHPGVAFFIPLTAGGREGGILCLSHKVSKGAFSVDDMYLLHGFAPSAAAGLYSAMLIREVRSRDTQLETAYESLERSERRYRSLVEAAGRAGQAIVVLQNTAETQFACVYANEEAVRLTGYSHEELSRKSWLELVHTQHREVVRGRIEDTLTGIVPGLYETLIVTKHGVVVPIEVTGSLSEVDGKPAAVIYFRDITERIRAKGELERLGEELRRHLEQTVSALSAAVDAKDPYTHGHSHRVAEYAMALGRETGLGIRECENLRLAGILHDVGMMAVPAEVLSRPRKLTPQEYEVVKMHVETSLQILEAAELPSGVKEAIAHHHECYDGSGYPAGLSSGGISLEGRILAVADALEAMTSDRAYRKAMKLESVLVELNRCSGTQFDPEVAAAAMRLLQRRHLAYRAGNK